MNEVLVVRLGPSDSDLERVACARFGVPPDEIRAAPDLLAPRNLLRGRREYRPRVVVLPVARPEDQLGFGLLFAWLMRVRPNHVVTTGESSEFKRESLSRFLARTAVGAAAQVGGAASVIGEHVVRVALAHRRLPLPTVPVRSRHITYVKVAAGYAATTGGSVTHAGEVVRAFRSLGVDVAVVDAMISVGQPARPRSVRRGARLLPGLAAMGGDLRLARVPLAAGELGDVLYQRATTCSAAGLLLAAAARRPLILEFNSGAMHNGSTPGLARYEAWIERLNLRYASRIVVVSEVLRDQLRDRGVDAGKVVVNPNGVDVERFTGERDAVRARLKLPDHAVVFGFVGTFGFWHGAPVLAEAFVQVARLRPDARLLLVGDGVERARTVEIIDRGGSGDVTISLGRVEPDAIPGLLEACDVLCSPHVPWPDGLPFHGSPTKLFEYMAAGRAIVASALGQIATTLDHERTALLVPPGDVEALRDAMLRLCDDEGMRDRLGDAAREQARAHHTWRAHADRILSPSPEQSA